MAEKFEFGREVEPPRWLVKDLIPLGHLCLLLAQSGVGKSFLGEGLAMHIASNRPFCGLEIQAGNVYIIDQDTPTNVLQSRLNRFSAGLGTVPEFKLEYDSMQGLSLDDGSLIQSINNHPDATFILIDSMHSICGKLDPNSTQGMSIWARVKAECLRPDCTIMIVHHLSEKMDSSLADLMNPTLHMSGMGNSVIKQQADTEYILGSDTSNGTINRLCLRCNPKRQAISMQGPVFLMEEPDEKQLIFEFGGYYDPSITEIEADVLLLMQANPSRDHTVKEIKDKAGNKWGETAIRKALTSLEKRKRVNMGRATHNMFRYSLIRQPAKPAEKPTDNSPSPVSQQDSNQPPAITNPTLPNP